MELESVTAEWVIDIFLLLLIGIGPKIALVPFLEATAGMPAPSRPTSPARGDAPAPFSPRR